MAPMRLEIVTAERLIYSEEVDILVAPGEDGELAVLPGHAPLLTGLRPGEIRVVKDNEDSFIAVSGGFLEVMANKVTILADTAEHAEEIDEQRAEEALRRAEERVAAGPADMDLEQAVASMKNTNGQLTVNGGIVASDVGILVPGDDLGGIGLRLNYDRRVGERLLDVKSEDSVEIRKKLFPAKITRTN